MTPTLTAYLGELADTLHDLRCRLREAARVEVARAIGEALREATRALICGPVRYATPTRTASSAWDDPWQEADADLWESPRAEAPEVEADDPERPGSRKWPPALVAGLGAARWSFLRTRQLGPAILIGLLVAVAAYAGGPTVKAVLETWATANDLLSDPGPDRRR